MKTGQKEMPMFSKRWMLVTLAMLAIGAFGSFVWPTPYRHDHDPRTKSLVRTNRMTGTTYEFVSRRGWVSSEQLRSERNEAYAAIAQVNAQLERERIAREQAATQAQAQALLARVAQTREEREREKAAREARTDALVTKINANMAVLRAKGYETEDGRLFYKQPTVSTRYNFKPNNSVWFSATGELASIDLNSGEISSPAWGLTLEGLSADGRLLYSAPVSGGKSFRHEGMASSEVFQKITRWRVR